MGAQEHGRLVHEAGSVLEASALALLALAIAAAGGVLGVDVLHEPRVPHLHLQGRRVGHVEAVVSAGLLHHPKDHPVRVHASVGLREPVDLLEEQSG
eukprot:5218547-Pyramimonas_sp.AAC.1